jgi:hypothetical protein
VDAALRRREGDAAALGLTIDGHPLSASGRGRRAPGRGAVQVGTQGPGEGPGVQPAQEPLEGGLVRADAPGQAEGLQARQALLGAPLGDSQDREVTGKHGRHGQGQERCQGKAPALRTAGVGDGGEGGEEIAGRHRRRGGLGFACGRLVCRHGLGGGTLHGALLLGDVRFSTTILPKESPYCLLPRTHKP